MPTCAPIAPSAFAGPGALAFKLGRRSRAPFLAIRPFDAVSCTHTISARVSGCSQLHFLLFTSGVQCPFWILALGLSGLLSKFPSWSDAMSASGFMPVLDGRGSLFHCTTRACPLFSLLLQPIVAWTLPFPAKFPLIVIFFTGNFMLTSV